MERETLAVPGVRVVLNHLSVPQESGPRVDTTNRQRHTRHFSPFRASCVSRDRRIEQITRKVMKCLLAIQRCLAAH